MRRAGIAKVLGRFGKVNTHNEDVQKLDIISDDLMIEHLSASGQFYALASEENENVIYPKEGKDGKIHYFHLTR